MRLFAGIATLIGVLLTSPGALAQEAEKAIAFEAAVKMPVRGDAFRQPRAVHADIHTGETYVCDTFRNRIVIFDQEGFFRFEIAGGSIFRAPTDVAVDPEGYILSLAVRHGSRRIVALDFDGKLVGEISFSGLPADWAAPDLVSIALSPSGDRLYALDREHQSLLAADRSGQVVSIVDLAADLDPDDAREQILGHVDTYGRTVLVTIPTAGRVFLYDLDLEPQGTVGIKGTSPCYVGFPVAAALDSAGKVVILDKQRALMSRWDPETNRCLREYSGFGNAPGALYQPDDMALNDSGSLFVSQGFEGRVQVFRSLTSAPPQIEELSLSSQTEAVAGSEIGTLSFAALQRLEMLEQASDARLAEADALDDQQTALRTELEGAKEALQELQENHAVVMNVLKTELDEARSQQAKNEAILESLMAEVATLSSESSSVLGGIEGLEVRQREQQGTAAAVRSEVDGFRAEAVEELSRLEDAAAVAQAEIAAGLVDRERLAAELAAASAEVEAATQRADVATAESEGLSRELAAVREAGAVRPSAESASAEEPVIPEEPVAAVAEETPAPAQPLTTRGDRAAAVDAAVRAWSRAWAGQQLGDYLASYAKDFQPEKGLSRETWADQRRTRVMRPHFIEIDIRDLSIELRGETEAIAEFWQGYRSNLFADDVHKRLVLRLEESGWRIHLEQVIDGP